jgi:Cof subfamily protein (haloacid dehalogenase superfamily)
VPDPAFPIRLVALDIDGTLVASATERTVPARTRKTIARVVAAGVEVVLVTGRMPAAALPMLADLELTAPLIAHHGAAIVTPSGALVHHLALEPGVALDALAWAEANGLRAHLNRLDELIMAADDPRVAAFERVMGVAAERAPDLRTEVDPPVTKVMIGRDGHELAAGLLAQLARDLGARTTVTSSSPKFVEVLAPGVSKARALSRFAERLGVPMTQVLAIGDDVTDADLLAAVGHPVAMPDAPAEVLALAAHIAPPLAVEGVATVLEELVLRDAVAR